MKQLAWIGSILGFCVPLAVFADQPTIPGWERIQAEVRAHFAAQKDYQPGDLISLREVQPLFAKLQQLGWKVPDVADITADVLPENHFLVQQMRQSWGKARMRRIATKKLIYDRLDRISQVEGGQRLIRDMAKLPDTDKAVDHMPDLLPKKTDGRTRTIKSYDSPTGTIYTEQDLVLRLKSSYSTKTRVQQ